MGVTVPVLSDGAETMVPDISGRTAGVTRFSHLDRLGTNAKTTDPGGNVVDSRSYDAFGLPKSVVNPTKSQRGFASAFGYQEDGESGLKLLGHRYYDSATGRFITRDPAQDGLNWYKYAGNNPLKCMDPAGLNYQFVKDPQESDAEFEEEQKDFLESLNNLAGTEKGDQIIWEILHNPGVVYKIRFRHNGAGSEGSDISHDIIIDVTDLTDVRYRTKAGGYEYFSWEHIIAHEAGHAIGGIGGDKKKGKNRYSDEQRVVDEWENSITRALGLPERGKYEDTKGGRRRPLPGSTRRPSHPPGLE